MALVSISIDPRQMRQMRQLFGSKLPSIIKKSTTGMVNDLAFESRKATQTLVPRWFPGAKSSFKKFMKRGVLVEKMARGKKFSVVGFSAQLNRTLSFEKGAGFRTADGNQYIAIPMNNEKRKPTTLAKKDRFFVGVVRGTRGIWQRTNKNKRLKLHYLLVKQTEYQGRRAFLEKTVTSLVKKDHQKIFERQLIFRINRELTIRANN